MSIRIPNTTVFLNSVSFDIALGSDEFLPDTEEEYILLSNIKNISFAYDIDDLLGPRVIVRCDRYNIPVVMADIYLIDAEHSFKWSVLFDVEEEEKTMLKKFLLEYEKVVRKNMWDILRELSLFAHEFLPR